MKGIPRVIDISGSQLFYESMIVEAKALNELSIEEPQGAVESFKNFFYGINSTFMEDVTGMGGIAVLKNSLSLGMCGPTLRAKLVNRIHSPEFESSHKAQ